MVFRGMITNLAFVDIVDGFQEVVYYIEMMGYIAQKFKHQDSQGYYWRDVAWGGVDMKAKLMVLFL